MNRHRINNGRAMLAPTKDGAITLIALVLTIIVILILAGVTISTLWGENGLLRMAGEARERHKTASREESAGLLQTEYLMWEYMPENYGRSLGDFLVEKGLTEDGGVWSDGNGNTYVIVDNKLYPEGTITVGGGNIPAGLQIGDYVAYTPTNGSYTALASQTGADNNQTFTTFQAFPTPADLKWRILDIENDQITLISETPVGYADGGWSGGQGSNQADSLTLKGAKGYNNAEIVMNNMCQALFSKANVGTARAMNWQDWCKAVGHPGVGNLSQEAYDYYYGSWYGQTYNNIIGYHPEVDDGTTQTTFSETTTYEYFWLDDVNELTYMNPSLVALDMVFGPPEDLNGYGEWRNWYYWLASRAVGAYSHDAGFSVG